MNGYYVENTTARKKNRAATLASASARADRVCDTLFLMVATVLAALRNRTVRTVLRYALVALCFVAFVVLVGAIEQETVSPGGGIIGALFLVFVEILCLK